MYYKLTDQNMQTYNGFQWELGKWYRIEDVLKDKGISLCTRFWFHCYDDKLLAVLFNPIHANVDAPLLFHCNVRGLKCTDGMKFGFTEMRLTEKLELPVISMNQRVAFGILCVKQVYHKLSWIAWADSWLSNKDRTANEAAAAAYAAKAAAYAADAADAAYAAYAAYAAVKAADAADAAEIDLKVMAKEAMKYE